MKRKFGLGLLIILTVFLFINCMQSYKYKVNVLSKSKAFKKSDLKGIAVFPLLQTTGVKYSVNGFDKIVRFYTVTNENHKLQIPGSFSYKKKVVAGILKEKLDYAYQIMFHKYKSLSVIDKKSLAAIGKKLGFKYIFVFESISEKQHDGSYNFYYKKRSQIYKVKIKFHIFDVGNKTFVYSVKSRGKNKFIPHSLRRSGKDFADAYDIAVEGAMSSLNKL